MDDETRVQYEGFRPGMYVRVEVCELQWMKKEFSIFIKVNKSKENFHLGPAKTPGIDVIFY